MGKVKPFWLFAVDSYQGCSSGGVKRSWMPRAWARRGAPWRCKKPPWRPPSHLQKLRVRGPSVFSICRAQNSQQRPCFLALSRQPPSNHRSRNRPGLILGKRLPPVTCGSLSSRSLSLCLQESQQPPGKDSGRVSSITVTWPVISVRCTVLVRDQHWVNSTVVNEHN